MITPGGISHSLRRDSALFRFMRLSLADVLAVLGIVLIGVGAWLIYPPAALLVVGAILLILGTVAAMREH